MPKKPSAKKSSGKMGMAHEKAEMKHIEALEHMHKGMKKKPKKAKK